MNDLINELLFLFLNVQDFRFDSIFCYELIDMDFLLLPDSNIS